jgi:hypothetical protein
MDRSRTTPGPLDAWIGRREFLVGAGALAVLAACGGGGGSETASSTAAPLEWSGLRFSSDLYASDVPQRFGFALTDGRRIAGGPGARIGFAPPGETETSALVDATYRAEGLERGRGVYVTDALLPRAGIWKAGVILESGEQFTLPFEVAEVPSAPTIGAPAPQAASPVPGAALGVDPICTRDPICPLHERSVGTFVGGGRPAAIMFATPARCQTQYCGPVLDLLLAVMPDYTDRVGIGHVEIYQGPSGSGVSPTVDAWGLESEPWFFTVDGSGRVVRRLDGAFDRSELREALAQIAA